MTRLYGPQVHRRDPAIPPLDQEPQPGPSQQQVHGQEQPQPPEVPNQEVLAAAQVEDEPVPGPSGLRRTWRDADPNADEFVKNAPYQQETVVYEDRDVRAKVKKTKHLKTHYYRLSDILYRLIIEPKRSNQLILVKSTHSIIYNALKEIWAQIRSYIQQPDWDNHRVIFTICREGIKSGIGISYYTLR